MRASGESPITAQDYVNVYAATEHSSHSWDEKFRLSAGIISASVLSDTSPGWCGLFYSFSAERRTSNEPQTKSINHGRGGYQMASERNSDGRRGQTDAMLHLSSPRARARATKRNPATRRLSRIDVSPSSLRMSNAPHNS